MLGALIGAATSVAGGLLNNKAQKDANRANEAAALRQEALQKEFAQSGIQWKVQDAEKAGIHPLYALGANTTSYQPTNVGGGAADFSFLGDAGQNIGRAINATRSTPAQALALQATKTQIEGLQLDNELKRTQLASALALANQTGPTPGMPELLTRQGIPGQSGTIEGPSLDVSKKISPTASGAQNIEMGSNPELLLGKTRSGYAPQVPQGLSESFEQDRIGYWQWYIRNKLFGDPGAMKSIPTRPGFRKHFSPWAGEYYYAPYPTYRRKGFKDLKGYPR